MSTFPTDDEREAVALAAEDALFRMHGVESSCNGEAEARIILDDLAPYIAAREMQAAAQERDRLVAAWNRAEEARALVLRESLAPAEDSGRDFVRGGSS